MLAVAIWQLTTRTPGAQDLQVLKMVLACCKVPAMVVMVREASRSLASKCCLLLKVMVRGSQGRMRKLLSLKMPGISVSNITCGATPLDDTCVAASFTRRQREPLRQPLGVCKPFP